MFLLTPFSKLAACEISVDDTRLELSPVQRGLGTYAGEFTGFESWNARKWNLMVQHVKSCVQGPVTFSVSRELITWKQHRRNEQSSEVWKSSSKDTDVYMSTRAQYAHGRKNEKFHSAQEASELKLKRLEQCWGKYHC